MGTLYLVATPIGNLGDITLRALRILEEVRLIAAEDTRVTRKLLSHYHISTRTLSYFEHNKVNKLGVILDELNAGNVALVSDAGTPGLNDPGFELVRAAVDAGHHVSAVPGPASPIAALTSSGLPTDAFLYLGYLPRKQGERKAVLQRVAILPYTLIFLESPHRLLDTLDDILDILGDRPMAAARELTKLHEEVWRGNIRAAGKHFSQPRGEFVLVVGGKPRTESSLWTEERLAEAVRQRLADGLAPTTLAASLADESGWNRRDIYKLAVEAHRRKQR